MIADLEDHPRHRLESALRGALRGRRLVYEIGLDQGQSAFLSEQLTQCIGRGGRNAVRQVPAEFPAICVIAIALEAVFKYDMGELWPNLTVRDDNPPILGKIFLRSLEELGLETFPVFDEQNAQAYVSRIVAHGGIPTSCLDKFFEFIDYGSQRGFDDASDYIELLHESRRFRGQLDKPIQRFLRDTGDVGADFLSRFLDLIAGDLDDPTPVLAERHGVPKHIVERFQAYRQTVDVKPKASRPAATPSVRPRIVFDLESGTGPSLQLAPISAEPPGAKRWVIIADSSVAESAAIQTVPANVNEFTDVALAPAAMWRVSLQTDAGSTAFSMAIPGTRDRPALVFDVATRTLIADPRYSPRNDVFVVAPCSLTTEATGNVRILSEYEMTDQSWLGWRAYEVIIEGPGSLSGSLGGESISFPLGVQLRPELILEPPIPFVYASDGRIVFSAPPRAIEVPWAANAERWAIHIRVGAGANEMVQATTASDFDRLLADRCAGKPIANVEVSLRGPVGSSQRIRFAIVNGLNCAVPDELLIPGQTPRSVPISADASIAIQHPVTGTDVLSVQLAAEHPPQNVDASDDNGERIGITIRPRRLRWRVLRGMEEVPAFGTSVVNLELDQSQPPATDVLQVECPGLQQQLGLSLIGHGTSLLTATTSLPGRTTGIASFRLAQLHDTMRAATGATFTLGLEIAATHVPLARFQEPTGFSITNATASVSVDETIVRFSLQEVKAFVGRVARIRSLDRPWRPSGQYRVADDARGDIELRLAEQFRVGRYRIDVALDDGWTSPNWDATKLQGEFVVEHSFTNADSDSETDPRERLATMLWSGGDLSVRPEEDAIAAPAVLLLLGEEATTPDIGVRLVNAFASRAVDWVVSADTAATEYRIARKAGLRAVIRLLSCHPTFLDSGESTTHTRESRLLELARMAIGKPLIPRAVADDIGARMGATQWIPPLGMIGQSIPNDLRVRRQIPAAYHELKRMPHAPLQPNGRAAGIFSLLLLRDSLTLIAECRKIYEPQLPFECAWPSQVRFVDLLRTAYKTRADASVRDVLVHFHVLTMLAACHVAAQTEYSAIAGDLLCSLTSIVPDYVETRVSYACWSRLYKDVQA